LPEHVKRDKVAKLNEGRKLAEGKTKYHHVKPVGQKKKVGWGQGRNNGDLFNGLKRNHWGGSLSKSGGGSRNEGSFGEKNWRPKKTIPPEKLSDMGDAKSLHEVRRGGGGDFWQLGQNTLGRNIG